MADNPNLVLTEPEAARSVGLSPRTMQRLRLEGGGCRYVQLTPRRIGYLQADLESWARERSRASTSAASPQGGAA